MAYKYPKGAKSPTAIVADVIATVSWIDFLLDTKIPHILFPIEMNKPVGHDKELSRRYQKFHDDVIQKMTYRQKVDMYFALTDDNGIKVDGKVLKINGKPLKLKRLFIVLGDFRNTVAHNPVMSLMVTKKKLGIDSVGNKVFYEQYDTFHKTYKILEPMIKDLEKSLS